MSEYQTLRPAPGAPPQEIADNLLPWHAPFDNEPDWTGVRTDEAIRDRLTAHRNMPKAEAEEIGSEYRSDRIPRNFRLAQFFIPDNGQGGGAEFAYDFHVSFPVWAFAVVMHGVFIAGSFSPPNASLIVAPYGAGYNFPDHKMINLPHAFNSLQIGYISGGTPTPGSGYHIWAFDRWMPPMFGPGN